MTSLSSLVTSEALPIPVSRNTARADEVALMVVVVAHRHHRIMVKVIAHRRHHIINPVTARHRRQDRSRVA